MLSEKQIVVRLPRELLERVDAMIPQIEHQAGSGERITRSRVVRMALARGMDVLDRELDWTAERTSEDPLRDRVSELVREEMLRLNGGGHLAGGDVEEVVKRRLRLKTGQKGGR